MDSLENPVDNVLTATPELPPPPKRIKIVRDGILAFIVAIALTLGLIFAIVIAGMISGSVALNSASFAPTPGFMLAMLFAAEIPFASVLRSCDGDIEAPEGCSPLCSKVPSSPQSSLELPLESRWRPLVTPMLLSRRCFLGKHPPKQWKT
jgi:hypothetical protein